MPYRKSQVRDLMTPDPITANPGMPLYEANTLMFENGVRRLPVVSKGRLVGMVTLSDIQRALPTAFDAWDTDTQLKVSQLVVGDVMTPEPVTASPEDSLQAAAEQMLENQVSALPVVEDERVVGILTESDIFRLVVSAWSEAHVARV